MTEQRDANPAGGGATRQPWRVAVEATLGLPLARALAVLEAQSRYVRIEPRVKRLGRTAFGLEGDALAAWCARAWWGRAASHAVYWRLCTHRDDEVRRELSHWSADELLEDLEAKRGLLLCGAHVGPRRVARWQCESYFPDLMVLAAGRPRAGAQGFVSASDPEERGRFVGRAIRAARNGGMILVAPDGRQGTASTTVDFLGRPVVMRAGVARVLALSGAASIIVATVWEGRRMRMISHRLPAAPAIRRAAEHWEPGWCQAYADYLSELCGRDAANLRLTGGFWTRGPEGVFAGGGRRA